MIQISDAAAVQLRSLAAEKNVAPETGLRLGVEKGGCAGLQYAMSIGACRDGDLVLEKNGARVFVDSASVDHLDGSLIDYEDGLSGAGFRIRNPKATRSCGCGTSFEPED